MLLTSKIKPLNLRIRICLNLYFYCCCSSFLIADELGPPSLKMSKIFHVQPPSSALYPADKPQSVVITFRSEKEMEIKDLSILKCQVYSLHYRAWSETGIKRPRLVTQEQVSL